MLVWCRFGIGLVFSVYPTLGVTPYQVSSTNKNTLGYWETSDWKEVTHALVKEAQAAVSSVLLMMPINSSWWETRGQLTILQTGIL